MLVHLAVFILSFVLIWWGSGMALKSVDNFSKRLRLSSFAISFLILGMMTSISEFSVGVNALIDNDPEIYVGNLIGASFVIFSLIIPLLAILGNKLNILEEFKGLKLLHALIVIGLPVFLTLDGVITILDSFVSMVMYLILVINIQSNKGLLDSFKQKLSSNIPNKSKEVIKILGGLILVFVASHQVVEEIHYLSNIFQISPFLISLLIISIGTNIPELSLVLRSLWIKNHQIAFGDYIGSAAFNTFFFVFLTTWYGKNVFLTNRYWVSLVFLGITLVLFYIFARSKDSISRKEGLILLTVYFSLYLVEIFVLR